MAMPEARGDAMYGASAELLAAAAQIGAPGWRAPEATILRADMVASLKRFVASAREASIPDAEIAEARYGLVAFIDDRVLRETGWPGRAEWVKNPLQLQFFREYAAGENFFARMRSLANRGAPFFALEVYYLCIALGFVGAQTPGGLPPRAFAEAVRDLVRGGSGAERIAPNAVPHERIRPAPRPFPIGRAAVLACVIVTVAGLLGLQLSLRNIIDRANAELMAGQSPPSAPGAGP
jgi:type IV/VI secretion system ImpK/VasF family protein